MRGENEQTGEEKASQARSRRDGAPPAPVGGNNWYQGITASCALWESKELYG